MGIAEAEVVVKYTILINVGKIQWATFLIWRRISFISHFYIFAHLA